MPGPAVRRQCIPSNGSTSYSGWLANPAALKGSTFPATQKKWRAGRLSVFSPRWAPRITRCHHVGQYFVIGRYIDILQGPAAQSLTAEAVRLYVFCNRVDGTGAMDPMVKDATEDVIQSRISSDGKVTTKRRAKRGRAAESTTRTIMIFL
jgi:hypothetical protein